MGETIGRAIDRNVEIEKALLGGIMLEPEKIKEASALLNADDFYLPLHQRIFHYCLKAQHQDLPIGFVEVYDELGLCSFAEIAKFYDCALPGSAAELARRVKEYARRRQAQISMKEAIEALGVPGADLETQFEFLSADFVSLLQNPSDVLSSGAQMTKAMKELDRSQERKITPTGFSNLDGYIGGFRPGEFWIIAGRPSMGKSAFAQNLYCEIVKHGTAALFVCVEGTTNTMSYRLLAMEAEIPLSRIRNGNFDMFQLANLVKVAEKISCTVGYVSDSEYRWEKIRATIENVKLKDPNLTIVFIDYVGLILVSGMKERREQLDYISAECKRLATKLHVTLVLLVQLNRQVEMRPDHHPHLSDLRETGAFEQDADLVLMLYRENYYNEAANKNKAELAILKNRDGPTGTVELNFEGKIVKFSVPTVQTVSRSVDDVPF